MASSPESVSSHGNTLTVHDKATNEHIPVRVFVKDNQLHLQKQNGGSRVVLPSYGRNAAGKFRQASPQSPRSPQASDPAAIEEEFPVRTVNLQSDEAPTQRLRGLSITGGAEHDMPIVIAKVGALGERNADIHEGDAILEISGVSVERATHQEAINLLRAGNVSLKLQAYSPAFTGSTGSKSNSSLHGGSFRFNRSATGSRSLRAGFESGNDGGASPKAVEQWTTLQAYPLQQACVSRRMTGTDKTQPVSFSLTTANGQTTPTLYCMSNAEVAQWCSLLRTKIETLDHALVADMNKSLAECDKIVHMGWVAERRSSTENWKNYVQRYMILTCNRILLLDTPVSSSEDLSRAVMSHPLLPTYCTAVQGDRLQDDWPHCLCITPADGPRLYLATDSRIELVTWVRHIRHMTVSKALDEVCVYQGTHAHNRVELSIGLQNQLTLIDSFDKSVLWKKPFSSLVTTSYGDNSVVLTFSTGDGDDEESPAATEDYDISFTHSKKVLHTVHNMLLATVAALDPSVIQEPIIAS